MECDDTVILSDGDFVRQWRPLRRRTTPGEGPVLAADEGGWRDPGGFRVMLPLTRWFRGLHVG